jgi:cell division protein FtsZ
VADAGLEELSQHVDSLIVIPNEKLLQVLGKQMSLINAFNAANDVLLGAVQGIAELITKAGMINVDFADVRAVMSEMGMAMMGTGIAKGEQRAMEAAKSAVSSPLLEDIDLSGAKGVLVNITAGFDMTIGEFEDVGNTVREFASEDATVVVGTVIDAEMSEELRVTVVATGLGGEKQAVVESAPVIETAPMEIVKKAVEIDYDKPTVMRKEQENQKQAVGSDVNNMDYLDIPAFLRRQAD